MKTALAFLWWSKLLSYQCFRTTSGKDCTQLHGWTDLGARETSEKAPKLHHLRTVLEETFSFYKEKRVHGSSSCTLPTVTPACRRAPGGSTHVVICRQCDREKRQQAVLVYSGQPRVGSAPQWMRTTSYFMVTEVALPSDYIGLKVCRSNHIDLGSYQVPNNLHQHNLLKLKWEISLREAQAALSHTVFLGGSTSPINTVCSI